MSSASHTESSTVIRRRGKQAAVKRLTRDTDDDALLPAAALVDAGPFGRSRLYEELAAGNVPPPDVRIGDRYVRWRAGTIRAWLRGFNATPQPSVAA